MTTLPLQVLDKFLLPINVGQVLLVAFVFALLAALPMRSRKVLSLTVILFGVVFLLTPGSLMPARYKFLGIGLVVVGPMLYVTARR